MRPYGKKRIMSESKKEEEIVRILVNYKREK